MAIRKKDGSVYRLQGPNPIMKRQAFWDSDSSVVHNFDPPEMVTQTPEEVEVDDEYEAPMPKEEEVPLQDIVPEEIHVPVKEIDPTKLKNVQKKRIVPKEVPRANVHILPAVFHESYDPLYDEMRSSLGYGTKFVMEVVVATQGDLSATFWTNSKEINKGSIIYVPKERRWWRVQETANKAEGWLMQCIPSDLQPSFED